MRNDMLRRYFQSSFCIFLQENTACDKKDDVEAVSTGMLTYIFFNIYRLYLRMKCPGGNCDWRVCEAKPRTPTMNGTSFLDVRSPGVNFLTKSE